MKEDRVMNKAELVAKVADKTGFKKKDAELALDAVLETIEKALVDGDSVRLIGKQKSKNRKKPSETGCSYRDPGFQGSCLQGWKVPQGRC